MDSDSVRHLFPQLFANGYTPIPNRDKVCMLPKWSTIEVDEWQCQQWARQLRWPAIGLRIEPPLLVLDYDVPNPDIAAAIRAITPRLVLDGALERLGSPPKTAFFLRLSDDDEIWREAHTRRYHFEGAPKPAFAVQAFAGGGGAAQFGCFGPHSHDDHGAVIKTYSWVSGRSPANVHIDELPELSRRETFAVLDAADALLASWPGLVVDEQTKSGESYQNEDVLTHEMTFTDSDGSDYSLEDLIAEAKARAELGQPQLRITGSFTGDLSSTGSPRCRVHYSKRWGVTVVDYKTCTTWRAWQNTGDPEVHKLFDEIFKKKIG